MTAAVDKLADELKAKWRGLIGFGPTRDLLEGDIDALARAAYSLGAKTALEEMARKKRAQWYPQTCPWVGALDDEAATYTTEEPS